jgi:hypothetical protein
MNAARGTLQVILLMKYILVFSSFPFPLTLTMFHMAFCGGVAWALVAAGVVQWDGMDQSTYIR